MIRFSGKLLAIASIGIGVLAAQPCLVHGDPDPVSTLATFAGVVHPRLTAVEPGTTLTVVLLPQTLSQEQRGQASEELTALYKAAGAPSPLLLSLFDGRAVVPLGAFPRLVAWQKAVNQAMSPESAPDPAISPAQFYLRLAETAGNFGGGWNSVLLVGQLPMMPEELRDYAAAWLSSRFCSQRIRLNVWNPDAGQTEFWKIVATATSGTAGFEHFASLLPPKNDPLAFNELEWPAAPIDRGFVVERGELRSQSGSNLSRIPLLRVAPGVEPPDIEAYASLRRSANEATALLQQQKLDESQVQRVRALLSESLRINPLDAGSPHRGGFLCPL